MSTETGDAKVIADIVSEGKELVEAARHDAEQTDMFDPTPEEILEARERLGPNAGNLAVLRDARERKRGRPPGAKNRRTDDFKRFILSFGKHPAITLMEIQSTPAEVLVENSRRLRRRRRKANGIEIDVMQTMSYQDALSLKMRAAEGLMPYLESKKPVDVNLDLPGDFNLIVPGLNISQDDANRILSGEDIMLGDWDDVPVEGAEVMHEPE